MRIIYTVYLDNEVIGKTKFENADPPMGVVLGEINPIDARIDYAYIKSYCEKNSIELVSDDESDKFISTSHIPQLKVYNQTGVEIIGISNQITGADDEGFEINIFGIAYPFYELEFTEHAQKYWQKTT